LCPSKFGTRENKNNKKASPNVTEENNSIVPNEQKKTVALSRSEKGAHITVSIIVINPITKQFHKLRAVLDNGADSSYITEAAVQLLQLHETDSRRVDVEVFGHRQPVTIKASSVQLQISNGSDFTLPIVADTTTFFPENIRTFDIDLFRKEHPEYAGYNFADPAIGQHIDVMIGNDYFFDLLTNTPKIVIQPGLHLVETVFG